MIHSFLGERRLYGTNTVDKPRFFHHTLIDGIVCPLYKCTPWNAFLHLEHLLYIEANEPVYFNCIKAIKACLVLNLAISKRNELFYSNTWQYQSETNVLFKNVTIE